MLSRYVIAPSILLALAGCAPQAATAPTPTANPTNTPVAATATPAPAATPAATPNPPAPTAPPSTAAVEGGARVAFSENGTPLAVASTMRVVAVGSGLSYTLGKEPSDTKQGEATVQLTLGSTDGKLTYQLNVLVHGTKGLKAAGPSDGTADATSGATGKLSVTGDRRTFTYSGKLLTTSNQPTAETYELTLEGLPAKAP
nr:fibronectin-attachment protein [uncultured bacterium]